MQGIGENFPSWSSVKGRRCPCCPLPIRSMVGLWFSRPSSGYALYLPWLGARDVRKMCGESAAQVERDSRGEEALAGQSSANGMPKVWYRVSEFSGNFQNFFRMLLIVFHKFSLYFCCRIYGTLLLRAKKGNLKA